ncbi:MAG: magnesium transporter CorA family protein [Saprospiraceae bacterium]|nr:magnesium transporter CorA family protein [Saprospiraceae bacterium]
MVRYYKKGKSELKELSSPVPGCWINVGPPFEDQEVEQLAARYDLPLDFLTDALDIDERSRYEKEEDVRLILINTPILNEVDKDNDPVYITLPIGIVLTVDHVITISSRKNPVLDRFLNMQIRNFDPSDEARFVLQLLDLNVHRFLNCLKELNLKRNLIERELYDSSRNKELKQLLSIEKTLVYFVNSLSANELVKMKMKRTDFLRIQQIEDKMDFFEDIIIDNGQALEMANVYANILNGTMDAYASIISNNLNLTIRRLTLITIFLAVPTLVASFYGMNVPLPFAEKNYALYIMIVLSVILSLLLAWYFQRKRFF